MFLSWASFGATMIGCWIKVYALSLDGGVEFGRVAHEVAVSVFGDVGEGVTAETPIQTMTAIRLVKYLPCHNAMCHRSIVNGRTMDSKS
jgi:hypothetical protein